ncbi:MAG: GOLPH3/VPS74 family protein [Chlorobiota bacterium]
MNLSITEKITLIALDDNTGIWVTDSMRLNYALACGILFELYQQNCLKINDGKVELIDNKKSESNLSTSAVELMSNLRNKGLLSVVYKIAKLASKSKDEILTGLVNKGILETKEVNGATTYPMIDASLEDAIKSKLIEIAHNHKTIEERDNLFLLKILANCKLQYEVFDKEMDNKKLAAIVEGAKISDSIDKATVSVINNLEETLNSLVVSASTINVN